SSQVSCRDSNFSNCGTTGIYCNDTSTINLTGTTNISNCGVNSIHLEDTSSLSGDSVNATNSKDIAVRCINVSNIFINSLNVNGSKVNALYIDKGSKVSIGNGSSLNNSTNTGVVLRNLSMLDMAGCNIKK